MDEVLTAVDVKVLARLYLVDQKNEKVTGQVGYVGVKWLKAIKIENDGWMTRARRTN